eukprot:TRINITY_DN8079_c0_g1_i1.p1 TRINITY_DN8079_c0_g1~~TRINITY_DN8079_c0_g1_i1.p1  ORF type:complete len:377 (-),score=44.90 TRINITY_DN8079_c0_g1_i1:105-1235(-)
MWYKKKINEKYVLRKQIGSGSYGVVWAAQSIETKEKFAIKELHHLFDEQILKRTLREIRLLRHFDHPNIIPLIDLFVTQSKASFDTIYMVFPLMDMDLHKLINSGAKITNQHNQLFTYQILRGLKYLHSASVLHRDLKPKNILVNSNGELRIGDLGMGRGESGPSLRMTLLEEVATPYYRAPEGILSKTDSYDRSVDVWACGCTLAELILKRPIFPGKSSPELISLIIDTIGSPTQDELEKIPDSRYKEFLKSLPRKPKCNFRDLFLNADPLALDLLEKVFVWDPEKRITVEQALAHPYLKELHDPKDEPAANSLFISVETGEGSSKDYLTPSRDQLRGLIWKEITYFLDKNVCNCNADLPMGSNHKDQPNQPLRN